MIKAGNGLGYNFNAQAMVDSANLIIVANGVSQDAMDSRNLSPMLAEVADTTGCFADVALADSGYYSGVELAKAEEMGAGVLVNEKPTPTTAKQTPTTRDAEKGDFSRENFEYDGVHDEYHCPYGGVLVYKGKSFNRKKGSSNIIYSCQAYTNCPFRDKCSPKRRRCITVSEFKDAINRQREKQKKPENKGILDRRRMIVEPVFGNIKHNMGFRRWTVRGIENVCGQWSLICLIVNLKKIYKTWAENI